MKEGIADDLLVALTADVDSTADVQNVVKNKLTKGKVILMRKPNVPKLLRLTGENWKRFAEAPWTGMSFTKVPIFSPATRSGANCWGLPPDLLKLRDVRELRGAVITNAVCAIHPDHAKEGELDWTAIFRGCLLQLVQQPQKPLSSFPISYDEMRRGAEHGKESLARLETASGGMRMTVRKDAPEGYQPDES